MNAPFADSTPSTFAIWRRRALWVLAAFVAANLLWPQTYVHCEPVETGRAKCELSRRALVGLRWVRGTDDWVARAEITPDNNGFRLVDAFGNSHLEHLERETILTSSYDIVDGVNRVTAGDSSVQYSAWQGAIAQPFFLLMFLVWGLLHAVPRSPTPLPED